MLSSVIKECYQEIAELPVGLGRVSMFFIDMPCPASPNYVCVTLCEATAAVLDLGSRIFLRHTGKGGEKLYQDDGSGKLITGEVCLGPNPYSPVYLG